MLIKDLYEVPIVWSLVGIAFIFAGAIFASSSGPMARRIKRQLIIPHTGISLAS